MRKGAKLWVKQRIAWLLIALMSIESFAAVVGDNDGSAFITKAEFDSLKNDFQSQIDNYNTSIDSKIDGAIAAYLSGINFGREANLTCPITNYASINWLNDLYWFGSQKHWIEKDVISENVNNGYYVPELNDKRLIFRGRAFYIYDHWVSAWSDAVIKFRGNIIGGSDGVGVGPDSNATTWPGVCLIKLLRDDKGDYLDIANPWIYASYVSPYIPVDVHDPRPADTVAWWQWGQQNAAKRIPGSFEFIEDTPSGSVLTYKLNFPDYGYAFYGDLSPESNIDLPTLYDNVSTDRRDLRNATSMCSNSTYWNYSPGMWNHDAWYNYMTGTDSEHIADIVSHSLLGQDKEILYNKFIKGSAITSGVIVNEAESQAEYGTLKVNIVNVNFIDMCYGAVGDPVLFAPGVDVDVIVPHFPTGTWSQTTSRQYTYHNTYLKFGQGLPLAENLDEGYLLLELNADVRDVMSGDLVDHRVTIDIKNSDFLDKNGVCVVGYDGYVDPNETTNTLKTFKRQQYDANNKKIKLTIPVKKDDALWLRLGPTDIDTLGLYANISDLKMKLVAN